MFILYSSATYLEVYKECVFTSNNHCISTLTRSSRLAHAVRRDERTTTKDRLLRRCANCAPRSQVRTGRGLVGLGTRHSPLKPIPHHFTQFRPGARHPRIPCSPPTRCRCVLISAIPRCLCNPKGERRASARAQGHKWAQVAASGRGTEGKAERRSQTEDDFGV